MAKATVSAVSATTIAKISKIEWWNRPITWAIGAVILLACLVGFLAPSRTPAASYEDAGFETAVSAGDVQVTITCNNEGGRVDVSGGHVRISDNQGIVNVR